MRTTKRARGVPVGACIAGEGRGRSFDPPPVGLSPGSGCSRPRLTAAIAIDTRRYSCHIGRVIDENAFGVLISYFAVEEDEYQSEDTSTFVERVVAFEETCVATLSSSSLGSNTTAVYLGHAFYAELAESEQRPGVIDYIRTVRKQLNEHGIATSGILTFGGRWVLEEDVVDFRLTESAAARVAHISLPSEPLRKALHAETACHGVGAEPGWGPGLYFDTEAVQALGLNLKNEPTPLPVADSTFFRVGR